MKFYIKILLVLFTLPLCAQTNWYISQQAGSDNNNGMSPSSPVQTVEVATDLLSPGDTLFFMGLFTNPNYEPNYEYTGDINDPHLWLTEHTIFISNLNGSEGAFITLKAYDSNTVFRGDGDNVLRILNSSYLRIEGLEVYGMVENIPLETALALQFLYREDNSINTLYRVPPGTTIDEVGQMTFPILANISRPSYTDTRGIYLTNVHHIDLLNNKVHHTPGNGFRVAECDYVNIIGNEVHNCSRKSYSGTHGLVVTKAKSFDNETGHKIFILQNKVHHNYNEIYSWSPAKTFINTRIDEGKGISLQRNQASADWTHGRFLIANNICYWNGYSGVHTNAGDRMDFINNTCFMNSYTNTITYPPEDQSGNNVGISTSESNDIRIYNNISFVDATWGGFPISIRNTTDLEIADNLVFGINAALEEDPDIENIATNTIEANPLFVDADNFNFQLLENSPAIDSANDQAPTTDFFGNTRIGNPDLGAIEYGFLSAVENVLKTKALQAYPNPFAEYIIFEDVEIDADELLVFTACGRNVSHLIKVEAGEDKARVNTVNLQKGIYVFTVNGIANLFVKL